MSDLQAEKLHVVFEQGAPSDGQELSLPRRYTLTHSDRTGDMFLTIAPDYDRKQISGWYTRLMRDEILAEWQRQGPEYSLHIYCHVSGGFAFGGAGWRNNILLTHMRTVIEAICYAERQLVAAQPQVRRAKVMVHFRSNHAGYNRVEDWGVVQSYGESVRASSD